MRKMKEKGKKEGEIIPILEQLGGDVSVRKRTSEGFFLSLLY